MYITTPSKASRKYIVLYGYTTTSVIMVTGNRKPAVYSCGGGRFSFPALPLSELMMAYRVIGVAGA